MIVANPRQDVMDGKKRRNQLAGYSGASGLDWPTRGAARRRPKSLLYPEAARLPAAAERVTVRV